MDHEQQCHRIGPRQIPRAGWQTGYPADELFLPYHNTSGYHWYITGEKFFELHVYFEELYNDLLVKIGDIAERVLTFS